MEIKDLIDSIQINQGISFVELSRNLKINSTFLKLAKEGKAELSLNKLNALNKIYNLKSLKIKEDESIIQIIDDKKYLNTSAVLPKQSKSGFSFYVKESNDMIYFWYQPKTRGKIELFLPKNILLDQKFFECLGLSIGDGLNNPGIKNNHYNFINTDFELVKTIYNWLINTFKLNNRIQIYLPLPKHLDIGISKNQVSSLLNIDKEKILVYPSDRNKKLSIFLQVSNSIFQCFYLELFNKLKELIISDNVYRKAFLKGLFAAE